MADSKKPAGASAGDEKKKARKPQPHDAEMSRAIILLFVNHRITKTTPMIARDVLRKATGRFTPTNMLDLTWLGEKGLITLMEIQGRKDKFVMPGSGAKAGDPFMLVQEMMHGAAGAGATAAKA